ncbi:hypothetical protein N7470_007333 [Penicillium chermesinum]|nr:hypothetical protein N7470_007333 [Penicillium chermesinum]
MLSSPRRWLLFISPLITLALIFYAFRAPVASLNPTRAESSRPAPESDPEPLVVQGEKAPVQPEPQQPAAVNYGPRISEHEARCGRLERDMDDILVVVKTGATEAQEKIPIQLKTGLQCVPHFVIFSDYDEKISGVQVYDILQNVTEETMRKEPEFQLYKKLQSVGREGLTKEDWGEDGNGPFGKTNNPGWKLDKWKFLPMTDGALEVKPDAKWFIFIEPDTYMVWQNLVNWLDHLDHTRSYYLGSPMQMEDMLFGYGGSGVILSNKAMNRLHAHRSEAQDELEQMTATEWAGDRVLARALEATHIYLTAGLADDDDHSAVGDRPLLRARQECARLHADVYRELIHNGTLGYKDDWDNLSGAEIVFEPPTMPSVDACADACAQNHECLQYAYNKSTGTCKHSASTVNGVESGGVASGWITHRVQRLLKNFQSSCPQVEYIFD